MRFHIEKYNGELHDKIYLFLFVLDLDAFLSHIEINPKRIKSRVANVFIIEGVLKVLSGSQFLLRLGGRDFESRLCVVCVFNCFVGDKRVKWRK